MQEKAIRKLTMFAAAGLVALVAVLAATAFGRNVAPELQQTSARTMPSIEGMTMSAENLPVEYFHAI
jgi:hypothetical protein